MRGEANIRDTTTTHYQVRLPIFEGPLDLLLHLIEKEELDITKVSLAQVTDQYLVYLARLEELSPDNLADFLVVAARLLFIKSQMLLPSPPAGEEEEEDTGDDLVQQLIEYRKFKAVAQQLHEREAAGLRSYVRIAPLPRLDRTLDLTGVTVDDLLEAVRHALETPPAQPTVNHVVTPLSITVADKIAEIGEALQRRSRVSFNRLLGQATSRLEIIVTFLAVLELIKRHRVDVQQERLFGEIIITARPDTVIAPAAELGEVSPMSP